ncbi:PilC/PilY family type IV pilus protein [Marinobacter oulmenensis]|uniref:Type IV pilus assembly protein PilY1 n=1 Tax=Marinobacter oulmenensis TaxID=643747 RepID=A0A840UHG0_9GAMM|nr:PilC/PilY family type IV pilus protein [Marinobacter oulmenensis]MBB5322161.1 type IV pilus assembly protein PilY1 [Marinobacter oulmenensis]
MNTYRFLRNVSIVQFLLLSPFLSSASADDTEIFFNIEQDVSAPNILFLLDNSGSMDADVEVESRDFDPSTDYSGNYSDDYIYYFDGWGDWTYSIKKSVIECSDISTKLNNIGKTAPYKMAYYYQSRWNSFESTDVNYSDTVCEADGNDQVDWSRISAEEFYSANYMNWHDNHRTVTTMTRLEIVKDVAKSLADGLEGVNVGLMVFDKQAGDKGEGGVIVEPVRPISEGRSDFKNAVDALGADTNTPLSETLFGAKRYFEGRQPFLSPVNRQADSAMDGNNYKSPIDLECQANHIVLLTDGEPTRDSNHDGEMENELGVDCSGNCLDEIADYMYNEDINSDFTGTQRVITHTVGFQTDQTLLSDTADKGNGSYYLAESADQLEEAFNSIFREVLSTNTTFSSPGVSVSNFNQLNHLDSLYFAVFEPIVDPLWPGNLKKYRLKADGTIVDQNGNAAVDESTGFFKDSAKSYWSSNVDGPRIDLGGASSVMDDDVSDRNVYTYYEGSSSTSLTASANNVVTTNDNLSKTLFGDSGMTDARLAQLIRWTRGEDVFDEDSDGNRSDSRNFLADPLHSRPYLQVYGGDEENPDTTVFYGDNQGYIHAVDGETGELEFSFIPGELLSNQGQYMDQQLSETTRPYGMDGSVVAWFNDTDLDRVVDNEDSVYIYAGMRRGGRNYYALDVTDRSSPSALWVIRGGSGDYEELAQTWSDPVKHRVRIGDEVKDVLFFSGGYDPNQDNVGVRTEDSMGRALYMVDAETGERLWWAGNDESNADLEITGMDYSIPATPTVVDVNGDGLADQIYVGDMGGQIFRFDLRNGQEADSLATGGIIADFAGDTASSNRRFFYSPDVSGTLKNGLRYLNLAIGSGYQAHPLDKDIDDRFYKITISSIGVPKNEDDEVEYTTLSESDLMDTTANLIQEGTDEQQREARVALSEANGWYIRFTRAGEKVLSMSTTLRGDVFFTTFEPSANLDPCIPAAGQSRLYHVKLWDGRAVVNYDGIGGDADEDLTASDRYVNLKTLGLPPSPKAITIDGVEIVVAGAETLMPPEPGAPIQKIYWYEE